MQFSTDLTNFHSSEFNLHGNNRVKSQSFTVVAICMSCKNSNGNHYCRDKSPFSTIISTRGSKLLDLGMV